MREQHYDVIIVGSGHIGSLCALMLASLHFSVAVVEAKTVEEKKGLGKAFALSETSVQLLRKLDLWSRLDKKSTAIEKVHVSSAGHFGAVRMRASDAGVEALGRLVNEADLSQVLHEALFESSVEVYCPMKLVDAKPLGEGYRVAIENVSAVEHLTTDCLIAADGVHSAVRSACGIAAEEIDYHEKALVTRLSIAKPHQGIAYERFTDQGTLAFMPQPNNTVALIITASNETIDDWLAMDESGFYQNLESLMGYRLGALSHRDEMKVFPLKSITAKEQAKPGLVLLGAAAHFFHPVAAQGLNLAIKELALLVDLLSCAKASNETLFGEKQCEAYLSSLGGIQKPIIGLTQAIVKRFQQGRQWQRLALPLLAYLPIYQDHIRDTGMGRKGYLSNWLK